MIFWYEIFIAKESIQCWSNSGESRCWGAESGDESTPSQGVDRCGWNREDVNITNQKKHRPGSSQSNWDSMGRRCSSASKWTLNSGWDSSGNAKSFIQSPSLAFQHGVLYLIEANTDILHFTIIFSIPNLNFWWRTYNFTYRCIECAGTWRVMAGLAWAWWKQTQAW